MADKLPSWIIQHNAKNQEEDAQSANFFKFPEGETIVLIDEDKPPVESTKFGGKTRYTYQCSLKDGQAKALEVGKQLDRLIIKALMAGINPMTVVRVGTDKSTKYSIKELWR